MVESPFDYAHRAAAAFMAANRCDDPKQAARLRQKAYTLLDVVKRDEQSPLAVADEAGWTEVLSDWNRPND